jgi:hypothetical protein
VAVTEHRTIPRSVAALLVGVLLCAAGLASAEVYKWVDEQGRTHYTDRPVNDGARVMAIEEGPSAVDRAEAEARAARLLELDRRRTLMRQRAERRSVETTAQRERDEVQRQRECASARSDLAALRQQRPVYRVDERGENVFLDDDQRAAMVGRLEDLIASRCAD